MKQLAVFCIVIMLFMVLAALGQPAVAPEEFSGQWYSSSDQSIYLFQEGLIYCPKHTISVSNTDYISGAYSFSRNRIFLFAEGINGLEVEKELYLVHKGEGSFLCENQDGSGTVYFIRYHN